MSQAIDLIQALAWPVVTLAALLLLRRPLGRALEALSGRVTRFSLSIVSIELDPLTPVKTDWQVNMGAEDLDVRRLTTSMVFDSWAATLFEQLSAEDGGAEVATIDLGKGDKWLTSRLFLFAVILERNRGVRCLAFTYTAPDDRRALFGLATPRNVRFALAQASPWLEAAWAHAYNTYFEQPVGPVTIGPSGALTVMGATQVAREFLDKIQAPSPAPGQEAQWLELPSSTHPQPPMFEHTTWVHPESLDDALDGVIDRNSRVVDDPTESPQERTRKVMLQRGPFVGLVDSFGRLINVVDRLPLMETAARLQLEADLAARSR